MSEKKHEKYFHIRKPTKVFLGFSFLIVIGMGAVINTIFFIDTKPTIFVGIIYLIWIIITVMSYGVVCNKIWD